MEGVFLQVKNLLSVFCQEIGRLHTMKLNGNRISTVKIKYFFHVVYCLVIEAEAGCPVWEIPRLDRLGRKIHRIPSPSH